MDSTHPVDLTDEDAVRDWVNSAAQRHGRIDILYNNAGATRFDPIQEQSYQDWHIHPPQRTRRRVPGHQTRLAAPSNGAAGRSSSSVRPPA